MNIEEAVRSLILNGSYLGIGTGSTVDSVEAVFGMAEHIVMKKGQKTMKYSWGMAVFENHHLYQLTFSAMSVNEAEKVKKILSLYENAQIDCVEGYFRYFRVETLIPHVQEVLFSTADEDNASVVSVAVVFQPVDIVELSVTLPKAQYQILRKISSDTRETINDMCERIIEKYIAEYDKK